MALSRENHYLKDLLTVFGISEADLEANRRGEITETQKKQMQSAQQEDTLMIVAVVWIFAAILFGITFFAWSDISRHMEGDMEMTVFLGGFLIVLPIILTLVGLYLVFRWWQKKDDSIVIRSVEGLMDFKHIRYKATEFYEVTIGSEKFTILPRLYSALKTEQAHRIYFVDSNKHIVSIEPITN